MKHPAHYWILIGAVTVLSSSCDHGASSGPSAPPDAGGSPPSSPDTPAFPSTIPTTYASVQLAPWCSLCFDASGATVVIDGRAGTVADLKENELVVLHGSRTVSSDFDSGVSWYVVDDKRPFITHIEVLTLLQGPVLGVDPARAQLDVLGQQVQFLRTALDSDEPQPASVLGSLAVGDTVRIAGYRSVDGLILATRIDHVDRGSPARLIGSLELGVNHYRIGSMDVDVSTAVIEGLDGGLRAGDVVAVEGSFESATSILRAQRIAAYVPITVPEFGTLVGADGLVASGNEPTFPPEWKLAFVDLGFYDTTCEYDAGFDLHRNQLWRLVGLSDGTGGVRVTCYLGNSPFDERDFSPVTRRLLGPIEATDTAAGTMTVLGVTVRVNIATRIGMPRDGWGLVYEVRPLSDLRVGLWADVRGFSGNGDDVVLAHSIVATEATGADQARMSGVPSRLETPDIVLNGQRIRTDAATRFRDRRRNPCVDIPATDFFSVSPDLTTVVLSRDLDVLTAAFVELIGSDPECSPLE